MPIEGCAPYARQDVEKYSRMRWWLGMTWGMSSTNIPIFIRRRQVWSMTEASGAIRNSVNRWISWLSASMKLGIRPKERVLLQLPNWHEFVFSFLALQKIGAIVVVLIPRHNQMEINHFCKLTEPVAWILPRTATGKKIEYQTIIDDVLKENPQMKHHPANGG